MTKAEAKAKLMKDLTTAGIAAAVIAIGICILMGSTSGDWLAGILVGLFGGVYLAGLPFGWRMISKVVTALSWMALLIKFCIAIGLGFIAFPVTIIIDIIRYCRAAE